MINIFSIYFFYSFVYLLFSYLLFIYLQWRLWEEDNLKSRNSVPYWEIVLFWRSQMYYFQ